MDRRHRSVGLYLVANAIVLAIAAACVNLELGAGPSASPGASAAGTAVALASSAPSVGPRRTKKPRRTPSPPAATAQATDTPAPTATATAMPTPDPAATPICCFTFRLPPIGGLESLPVFDPIIEPKLDYTANPNYGIANLPAGFTPDPNQVNMTSGGDVDVSYLGTSCSGFATSAPDLRVNFSGTAALLRIYFVASSGDATMVVNDPFGNFYCVDDSFGTVNPTIDFNNPSGGTYDIWVGSFASGTFLSGTLNITANSGNHP